MEYQQEVHTLILVLNTHKHSCTGLYVDAEAKQQAQTPMVKPKRLPQP